MFCKQGALWGRVAASTFLILQLRKEPLLVNFIYSSEWEMEDNIDSVIRYHERTKHHPRRYARSPGFLDWSNEPDPFRRYEGSRFLSLPLSQRDPDAGYHGLYERSRNIFQPFSLENISTFLELSLGLSAWKSYAGSSWALRINPSSGNLHPTEAYLILPPFSENDNRGGIYHYNSFFHALEQRAFFDEFFWSRIRKHFGADGFLMGLSSIYWRESWKYGERAFRYCQHDIGHAMASLSFAGNLLGWKLICLDVLSDEDAETLLGFRKTKWKRAERENPGPLLFVYPASAKNIPRDIPPEVIESFQSLSYFGEPNRLSGDHKDWPAIDEVSAATEKPRTPGKQHRYREYEFFREEMPPKKAATIIRQRRSALAFDGKTVLPKSGLFGMLDKTVPRGRCAPFDMELGEPSVHLLIFLYGVSGLEPGIYFLVRNLRDLEALRSRCRPDFLWESVEGTSEPVHLYLLRKGDFRNEGATTG